MKLPYLIYAFLFIFASCTPNTKPEKMLPAKKDTVVKSITKPAAVPVPTKQVERTTLSYIDFILIDRAHGSTEIPGRLRNKGFLNHIDAGIINKGKILLEHKSPKELLLLSTSRTREGEWSCGIDYYFFSEAAAKHFTDDLVNHHKFTYNEKQNRYTLFLGTYETKYVILHKQAVSGGTVLYHLEYRHDVGKELSAPQLSEQDR